MIKYLEYIEIIPFAFLTIFFILLQTKDEHSHYKAINKCKLSFIKILFSLLIFGFLFLMLVYTNINKYLICIFSIILWIVLYFIRCKYITVGEHQI